MEIFKSKIILVPETRTDGLLQGVYELQGKYFTTPELTAYVHVHGHLNLNKVCVKHNGVTYPISQEDRWKFLYTQIYNIEPSFTLIKSQYSSFYEAFLYMDFLDIGDEIFVSSKKYKVKFVDPLRWKIQGDDITVTQHITMRAVRLSEHTIRKLKLKTLVSEI